MRIKLIFCLVLLLCLNGCGSFSSSSGTWENDPDNWRRAFQSQKPDDVIVLYSWYWRSAHWSYEFQYFFEIERNDKLQQQLFTHNKMVQLKGKGAIEAWESAISEAPKWFAPKAADQYEIWICEDEPGSNFRVLVDKETGNLFLTDHQI